SMGRSELCPEVRRCGLVVIEDPRLGDLVAAEVEDVWVGLVKRLLTAGAGCSRQDDDALITFGDLIDHHAEGAVRVAMQAAKLGHHGIDAMKVLRALAR